MKQHKPISNLHLMPDATPLEEIDILTTETLLLLREKGILTFGDLRKALAPEKENA